MEINELDTLAEILPLPREIEIMGKQIDVSPLKLGEIVKITKQLKTLKSYWSSEKSFAQMAVDLLTSDHAETVLDVLAILCRESREFIDALGLDDAIELLTAVLTSNIDVFQKKMLPALATMSSRIATQVQSA